jgi:hypothetical protein
MRSISFRPRNSLGLDLPAGARPAPPPHRKTLASRADSCPPLQHRPCRHIIPGSLAVGKYWRAATSGR